MSAWMTVLAPLGVGVMIAVSWLLGGMRTSRLRDAEDAVSRLQSDFPDFEPTETVVGAYGKTALCSGAAGIGVVTAWGDRFVTAVLRGGDVISVACRSLDDRDYLDIRTSDFSRPHIHINLNANDAVSWRKRLESLAA